MTGQRQAPGWRAEGHEWSGSLTRSRLDCSSTPVRAANGKAVARIEGDCLVKRATERDHMLRRPLAWATDVCALTAAEAAGARFVEIRATDTGRSFRATIAAHWSKGFRVSRGFGEQRALGLEHWCVTDPGERAPEQLGLFAEVPA